MWHSCKSSLLKKLRKKRISKKKDEVEFAKKLKKIGYFFPSNKKPFFSKVIKAFQRHYRKELIDGVADEECLAILDNLSIKNTKNP